MKSTTTTSIALGFFASLILTLLSYGAVVKHWFSGTALVSAILAFAVVELVVQLYFFFDLGDGASRRWKLGAFAFTLGSVLIVIVGSVWIMSHLNYNMMASPDLMNTYIQSQQGF